MINFLEHVRRDIESPRLKARTPNRRRINAQRKNVFAPVKTAVELFSA